MRLSDGSEVAAYFPASPADAVPLRRGRSYGVTASVAIPVAVLAEVDDLAEAAGVSRSRWIAAAVESAVAGSKPAPVEVRG